MTSDYELTIGRHQRKVGVKTICVLAGGFLIHLSLGTFFTFGNMSPYMVSYLRNRTDDTNVRNIDGLWVISVGSLGNCFGMTIGGILDRRFGPRISAGIGCLIFSGAIAANYFCVKTSFAVVILTYGFISNFGNLMAYGITVQTAIKWLPQRPSLASGLIVSGFGGGTLIFNQVQTAFINPDNLSPDLETSDGDKYFTDPDLLDRVPVCFVMLGGIYFAMQCIGLLFIRNPLEPDEVVSIGVTKPALTEGNDRIITVSGSISEKSEPAPPVASTDSLSQPIHLKENPKDIERANLKMVIIQALKSRSFYIVWVTVMAIAGGMQFVSGLYKAYGQTFIEDDHFLALVGTISSIFNCLGRPFWGMMMDRFGFRVVIRCLSVGMAVSAGTLLLTEQLSKGFFMLWICSAYFFFCGTWAVCPSTLAKLFGVKNMAINYGFINVALGIANLVAGVFGVTLKDSIGWNGIFFMSCGMFTIPFFLSFLFRGIDTTGRPI